MSSDDIAERRQRAADVGKCVECMCRPMRTGRRTCYECASRRALSKERAINHQQDPRDWCSACQANGFHREGCPGGER